MPALAFLAWVGLALAALLFVADATLVDHGPAIVVSQRIGLPEQWHPDPDSAQTPTPNPIPTPEMTSQAVISNQPVSEAEGHAINPAALAVRAEALPKKEKRVTRQPTKRPQNYVVTRQPTKRPQNYVQEKHVQQSSLFDRLSIRDQ
jgi:hypothetical protein